MVEEVLEAVEDDGFSWSGDSNRTAFSEFVVFAMSKH